jgi:hypothetical protein
MDGFALTYYKLLTGECHTSGPYGEDFLYRDAVKWFCDQVPIYREIIDTDGNDCELEWIDEYLMMIHALLYYYEKVYLEATIKSV